MGYTTEQLEQAQAVQNAAARDQGRAIRLVAGPGSGKSFAIVERVRWLLQQRVDPESIFVVSFTRAASYDLGERVRKRCREDGLSAVDRVRVSTLHSLALKSSRTGNRLQYPVEPLVMDDWELNEIFDPEFSVASGYRSGRTDSGYTTGKCKEIRIDFEALCATGVTTPAPLIEPDPPISEAERETYKRFHQTRTQLYSCVLPGEIVRQCVQAIDAGVLEPATLLGMQHLIVDEYQDLNPMDLKFVDRLAAQGVVLFVAGDDDQSIYSFRYASPEGIQSFPERYPGSGVHELKFCFRCTPAVLSAAQALLTATSSRQRISKSLSSVYLNSAPPEPGIVNYWKFTSATAEANAIAESCQSLVEGGLAPREILVLVSNKQRQLPVLEAAFERIDGLECESPRDSMYIESKGGRFVMTLLRIVCQSDDYVAHRTLLSLLPGVGHITCNGIAEKTVTGWLNFRVLFYAPIPKNVFSRREIKALEGVRNICQTISNWAADDTIQQRSSEIGDLLCAIGQDEHKLWAEEIGSLPPDMTLEELRNYLWTDTVSQRANLLEFVYDRLGLSAPNSGILPQTVPQPRAFFRSRSVELSMVRSSVLQRPALQHKLEAGSSVGALR